MPDYDLHQLSPYDLEILSRDLLQAGWGVNFESFKTGKDGGIDFRYASGPNNTIVQVKHYFRTGLKGLLRDLKAEAVKVRRLNPSRYVLVTSVPLSPVNKDEIVQIIGSSSLKPVDILGPDDINNLLGQHPEVEGRHYKLWLASRGVLDRVINNAAITRSEFKVRQVYEQAKRYVVSDSFSKAKKMLDDERVVIIAGAPGVGKTTLADLLLYYHLEQGYQAVLIQRDVEEGETLFQPGIRQIFYFDDFMGATFASEHPGSGRSANDRALVNFIAMVRATPEARLVLTTREHIYTQALQRSERLRDAGLDDIHIVLSMPSYSSMQRAHILYNHLCFSDLPYAYRNELLRDCFFMRIVNHKKFNPRLIQWLSSYRRLKNVPVERYRRFIEDLLQDPFEIWRHAYEQEITESGRSVLLSLRALGGRCGGPILDRAFSALHSYRARKYNFSTRPEDFRKGIREVVNSFIKPWGPQGFEVIDPSVLDLLNSVVRNVPENAVDMIVGAASFDQIDQVWALAKAIRGDPIITTLKREAERIAPSIVKTANSCRRVALKGGGASYFGSTYEHRLAVVVEIAQWLEDPSIVALITPIYARLIEEWRTEGVQIIDAVELILALDAAVALSSNTLRINSMRQVVFDAAMEEARAGCCANELRELLNTVDSKLSERSLAIARESFVNYRQDYFIKDLRECRSSEQYSDLIEDMELFRDLLDVDVYELIERVEEEKAEFDENADQYADYMQDEWKERNYHDRAGEYSITDMFNSLKGEGA